MRFYLHDMILEIPVPIIFLIIESPTINIFYFFFFFRQLYDIVFCCKVIIFSWYFNCSCNFLVTISFSVISFFFVFLEFIPTIFLLHPILIKVMTEFQKFIIFINDTHMEELIQYKNSLKHKVGCF